MAHRTFRFLSLCAASVGLVLSLSQSVVQAYNARTDVVLDRLTDETFDAMKQRAEVVARAAAQRSFDRDVLISDVSVNIIARHNGSELPLMTLGVSRLNWQNRPDVRRWATYYKSAQLLLQLPSQGDLPIPNSGGGNFNPFPQSPNPAPIVPSPAPSAAPLPIDTPGVKPPAPNAEAAPRSAGDAAAKAGEAAKKKKAAKKQPTATPAATPTPKTN
jgi:hypothetical protein